MADCSPVPQPIWFKTHTRAKEEPFIQGRARPEPREAGSSLPGLKRPRSPRPGKGEAGRQAPPRGTPQVTAWHTLYWASPPPPSSTSGNRGTRTEAFCLKPHRRGVLEHGSWELRSSGTQTHFLPPSGPPHHGCRLDCAPPPRVHLLTPRPPEPRDYNTLCHGSSVIAALGVNLGVSSNLSVRATRRGVVWHRGEEEGGGPARPPLPSPPQRPTCPA